MEETATSVSNTSTTTPSTHSNTARQTTTSPTICIVCGAPALYSYYGAIVCHSCKVFFRRNAKTRSVSSCEKYFFYYMNLFRYHSHVIMMVIVKLMLITVEFVHRVDLPNVLQVE
jgi:predicted amidophosphoribosyltransferase